MSAKRPRPTPAATGWQAIIPTPLGPLGIRTEGADVTEIEFLSPDAAPQPADDPLTARAAAQLEAYFADSRQPFTLPLRPRGTPFQQSVWRLLRKIPTGQVWTYGQLAQRLGSGPRAVGNACRHNPLPVIVPCHRVVGASGLGGYAGQTEGRNMEIKCWLLIHEGVRIPS